MACPPPAPRLGGVACIAPPSSATLSRTATYRRRGSPSGTPSGRTAASVAPPVPRR
ncbi:hypothetical protein BD414DRAFT_472154 [Trametes punicea]|nr:hypothetical protein BD414DRAFT_472154 [Trametes punicea]